ncbi:MAG: tetratricopeptide repeat protein [Candidatus Poribacteria bacterium]|nr:tetratricopeptide repeat protein [Candidatus Poribacteria bacterium]MDE0505813.1 tetratricopeptide repeat protein [Candidatus Poribacteria bacterium]
MPSQETQTNRKPQAVNYRGFIRIFMKILFVAIALILNCSMTIANPEETATTENPPVFSESRDLDLQFTMDPSPQTLSSEIEFAKKIYTQLAWATYLHSMRRLSDAKEMYLRVLENHEPSAFIHTKLAELSREMQDIKSAERECRRAIELQPDRAAPHFLLGDILFQRLQQRRRLTRTQEEKIWTEMIAEFRRVTELQPDHVEAHRYLASISTFRKKHELAIHSYKELTRIMPYHARFHLDLAELYDKLEQNEKAIAAYERAVKIDRDLSKGHNALGKLYVERFEQIMDQPETPLEQLTTAKLSLEKAIVAYQELRRLDSPENLSRYDALLPHLRARLGSLCVDLGDDEKGIEILREILLEHPDNVDANYWIGIAYQKQDDLERAYPYLKKATALVPGRIARQYFAMGQYDEAIDILEDVLNDDPENVEAVYWAGLAYEGLGNNQKTEFYLRQAISLAPKYADALNALGYFFAENGTNLEEAVDLIKMALKESPKQASYIDSLGWAFFKQGKLDEALEQLEIAMRLMPESAEIQDHLGDAYMKKGLKDKAIAAWQRAIRLEPNNMAIREKLKAEISD